MGALYKLDEFLLNPQVRNSSVAVPGTSSNNASENWGPTGDCSLVDTCSKAVFSPCHSSSLIDSEQEETHHIVTGVQEEISYCSRGTWPGKQKKARFTGQPQLRIENNYSIKQISKLPEIPHNNNAHL